MGPVNDPKKQATPIESETDSVIFMGRELRGMNGFKIKSRFNKKANTETDKMEHAKIHSKNIKGQ